MYTCRNLLCRTAFHAASTSKQPVELMNSTTDQAVEEHVEVFNVLLQDMEQIISGETSGIQTKVNIRIP